MSEESEVEKKKGRGASVSGTGVGLGKRKRESGETTRTGEVEGEASGKESTPVASVFAELCSEADVKETQRTERRRRKR